MKSLAQRMNRLPENFFAGLENRIKQLVGEGYDVIRLDVGSPDLPPPEPVVAALQASARRDGHHGYQPHRGPEDLRTAWVELYREHHGVALDPDTQVAPLVGSKEGIFHLTQAFVDPGDVVLVPDPGYMTYSRAALFAGGEVCSMPLRRENGYLPDLSAIPAAVLQRTKIMWLNYPNNPTAATASLDFFSEAAALAQEYDILLCQDAAYSQVTFDGCRAASILEAPGALDTALEFNSVSKSYNMAGWRVGAALGNAQAVKALFHLKTNVDSSHFLPILEASAVALRTPPDWVSERNAVYRRRRDLTVAALRGMGLDADLPKGSIYVWFPVPAGWTSLEFVTFLLDSARVSLTPGTVFGPGGEGYARIALTTPEDRIQTALERTALALEKIERRNRP